VEPVWLADCLLVVELKVAKAPASVEAYRSAWPRLVRLGRLLTGSLELGEDLSEAEIAKVLGCRPGTVKSLTSRALARLRDEVTR
jgi:DNA-directed RNA polymerase specialized sigma24 family protein